MSLSDLFPEIYRYRAQDAGRVRLVSGLAGALAVCAAAGYSVAKTTASWGEYLSVVTMMQFNMLVFYGALCTGKSVAQEKAERTWDFQRLTPLTSFDIAAGKFLGAPVFAWFLFACMLPAACLPPLFSSGTYEYFFGRFVLGLPCALLSMAAGLLVSAYDDTGGSGLGHLSGPLAGLAGLVALNVSFRYADAVWDGRGSALYFYGASFSGAQGVLFISASFLAFAAWAFLGARCRIGGDLLERRRAWRLPAFVVFTALYVNGFEHSPEGRGDLPFSALTLASLTALIAAFLSPERGEYWRRWLKGGVPARLLDDAPAWMKGFAAAAAVAAGLYLAYGLAPAGQARPYERLYVILPLFLLRDLMFLQWCRFTASRRPEMMALAYLAMAYALPMMVLAPTGLQAWLPYFVPYARAGTHAALNLAGPLAQAGLMGWLLYRKAAAALKGGA